MTAIGLPLKFVTAREHVASKPRPLMWERSTLDAATTCVMASVIWDQISVVDCSKMRESDSRRYVCVAWVDSARMLPSSSTKAALAEPVPLLSSTTKKK